VAKSFESQDRAYHTIRRMLLEGRIQDRKDLSRRRLAAKLGVSPSCVQPALGRLEAERLLVSIPQSGTYLRPIDFEEYQHHWDIRELLEPYAVRRAARWLTAAQAALVELSCDEITAIRNDLERDDSEAVADSYIERVVRVENLFHGTIMEAARNPTAAHFMENLRIQRLTVLFNRVYNRATWIDVFKRVDAEHRGILEALRAGDGEAAEQRMLLHLQNGRRELPALVAPSEPQATSDHSGSREAGE
jgi:DNA-binding GntR family transcriptional regulator